MDPSRLLPALKLLAYLRHHQDDDEARERLAGMVDGLKRDGEWGMFEAVAKGFGKRLDWYRFTQTEVPMALKPFSKKQFVRNSLKAIVDSHGLTFPAFAEVPPEGVAASPVGPVHRDETVRLVDAAVDPFPGEGVPEGTVGVFTKDAAQQAINAVWRMVDDYEDDAYELTIKLLAYLSFN